MLLPKDVNIQRFTLVYPRKFPGQITPSRNFSRWITPSWVIALLPAFFFYLFIPQARYKNFKLIY